MSLDLLFDECKFNVEQMKRFDPEPLYVHKFLIDFLNLSEKIVEGILEEADRDFGLFVGNKLTLRKFEEKAKEKKEKIALRFASWFKSYYKEEHKLPYPNSIQHARAYLKTNKTLPLPRIKLLSKSRYKGDPSHPIPVPLNNGRLVSRVDLEASVDRNKPFALDIINSKRAKEGQPSVSNKDITSAAFLEISEKEFEVAYSCQLYLSTLRNLISESRRKIRENLRRN